MTLTLNGIDITEKWGIYLEQKSVQALMLPATAKKPIENKSRLINGYEYIPEPLKYQHRSLTLVFAFSSYPNLAKAKFSQRVGVFVEQIPAKFSQRVGVFVDALVQQIPAELRVDDTTYKLIYQSCRTLNTIKDTAGTLAIVFDEPDIYNRVKHIDTI